MVLLVFVILDTRLLECNVSVRDWLLVVRIVIDVLIRPAQAGSMVFVNAMLDFLKPMENVLSLLPQLPLQPLPPLPPLPLLQLQLLFLHAM